MGKIPKNPYGKEKPDLHGSGIYGDLRLEKARFYEFYDPTFPIKNLSSLWSSHKKKPNESLSSGAVLSLPAWPFSPTSASKPWKVLL